MTGRHITVDATVADSAVFSHAHLDEFFRGMCKVLNMEIIFGPVFKDVEIDPVKLANVQTGGAFQDEGGTTGIVVISTSHISIHTWQLRNFFQLDVFSCKDFDGELALAYVRKHLDVVQEAVCEIVRYDESTAPTIVQTKTNKTFTYS